ncbi:NAD(P)/FAD-dependent oxidoreductase [Methanobacterium ferruginis]|uniref:NAD(P)/FAD-dependent oxidoreductase n=1 Tax=Methanobacterium ferruginis TaxID=710191 RepID=UPI0025724C44|nr:NAD(P)/FAD-dependent oxidoreductase [Methanobacterium ferruginis]BDZ67788.1 digeranylgeranylglycerophospholipid reductase [Methanobacterium ferruginis]
MKYDLVVVGGRIGGSISSLFASQNDVDVLMIEKRQEIGVPVQCAEGVPHYAFEALDMEPSKKYVCTEVGKATVHAPNGKSVNAEELVDVETLDKSISTGYILDRKVFDKHLAIESARAGTDIMVKTTVKDLIRKDGKICGVVAKHLGKTMEIKADMVIAADGIESNIAKIAGFNTNNNPTEICSCAQYELVGLNIDPDRVHLYFGREIAPGGYSWIFPKGKDIANVGLGIRGAPETAYHYLKKFTSKLNATPVELNLGGVPLSGPIDKTYTDGLLVVGDAARQVDPVTGGGIFTTAPCARIAGEVAAEAIKEEDTSANFLKKYDDMWRDKLGDLLKTSIKIRKVADKITDDEMNALVEFLEVTDPEKISKLSFIKFLAKHPRLLRLVKDLL